MRTLVDHWLGILGLSGLSIMGIFTAIAGLSWIPGVGLVLRVIVAGLEAASPIINGIFAGLIWVWSTILLPGILDILDNWSTIFTVILMGTFLWIGLIARYEAKLISKSYVISKCSNPEPEPEVDIQLPWPFNWK